MGVWCLGLLGVLWICCLGCCLNLVVLVRVLVNSVVLLFFVLLVLDFGWIVCYCLVLSCLVLIACFFLAVWVCFLLWLGLRLGCCWFGFRGVVSGVWVCVWFASIWWWVLW